jgi:hypothetical protein
MCSVGLHGRIRLKKTAMKKQVINLIYSGYLLVRAATYIYVYIYEAKRQVDRVTIRLIC